MTTSGTTYEHCSPGSHQGNPADELPHDIPATAPAEPAPTFWGELCKMLSGLRHIA